MDITYRPLCRRDYPSVKAIIFDAWEADGIIKDPETVSEILSTYLYGTLVKSNFTLAAECDGQVVGFLFGRHGSLFQSTKRLDWYLPYIWALLKMEFSPNGRQALKFNKITNRTNRKLRYRHARHYDGELTLFAIDRRYRGRGIGRHLEEKFNSFMAENGARNYYLYTDTYSNYQFYDKHGFRQVAEETVDWEEYHEEVPPRYFIYDYELSPAYARNRGEALTV